MFNFISTVFRKTQLPIEQKASTNNPNDFMMQILKGDSAVNKYCSADLLTFNRGWVAACLSKNSSTISSIPIKLFYKSKGKSLKATKNHSISQKQFNFIKQSNSVKDIKSMGDVVEIEDHLILDILNMPNDRMNYTDLINVTQSYLGLIGNAYWYKVRNKKGEIESIMPLSAENITAEVSDNGIYKTIQYYKYTNPDNIGDNVTIIPKKDIMHFANYGASNLLWGKGELEACITAAERELYYDQFENYINKNNARPDYGIIYKNGIKENERKDIKKSLLQHFGGVKNSGKPLVMSGDVDIKQLGFAPKDMQYKDGRDAIRQEIASVFGVPEALITLNSANYASAAAASTHYANYTIIPKLNKMLEKINEQLVAEFDPELFIWYDDALKIDTSPLEQSTIDATYIDKGVYNAAYVQDRMGVSVEAKQEPINGAE